MATWYPVHVRAADRCGEIAILELERPDGYDFRAGQWLRLNLDTSQGKEAKTFSIASGPQDAEIVLATRDSGSAFKRAWSRLREGDVVDVSGPGGRLTLPDVPDPVFLVGGVGITPIRGLIRDAVASGRPLDGAVLVYGNRKPGCTPFLDELDVLSSSGMRVVHVFENGARPGDESGFIDSAMVERTVPDARDRTFVVTGPPPMVSAMEAVLDQVGVPSEQRVIERFGPTG